MNVWNFFYESYVVLCLLAPWVLLGAAISGILHALLPASFIRRQFRGRRGVFQAVLLGVPLPLCSCGVIPAGIGLKKQGASSGAAMGFLISTPQTGVDSILVTAAMLGWPLAIFKMITAAITGIVGGLVTDTFVSDRNQIAILQSDNQKKTLKDGLVHSLEIIRSIWIWLVFGIFVSALITIVLPEQFIATVAGWGTIVGALLALLISLPMYVCATASVPIAAALVSAGLPPGAALVFLMAGPATNVATISAVASQFGWKTTSIYLSTVIIGSILFAVTFDIFIGFGSTVQQHHEHIHVPAWWEISSAFVLAMLFCKFFFDRIARASRPNTNDDSPAATSGHSCCSND